MFFNEGLSNELKHTFDKFIDLEPVFGDNLDELKEMTNQYVALKEDLDKIYGIN